MTKSATVPKPLEVAVPHYQPAEPAVFAKKRLAAREALGKLPSPSDKKYTNWIRYELLDVFKNLPIGGREPQLTIDQADYETGLKTIAIPLAQAIKDWPDQVEGYLMGEALPPDGHYFSALSGAFYTNGGAIVVPDGVTADVSATYGAESGKLNAYRTIIVVGKGAKATFTELTGKGRLKSGTVITHGFEVYLAEGAQLDFYTLQEWPDTVLNFPVYRGRIERDATLNWLIGSFGSKMSQLSMESQLNGEGAQTNVRAVYYGTGNQHFDQELIANHLVGHTSSDTYARGIVDDTARAVYRGMIKIQPGAHGSSADQNGHAMLLKNTAHQDSIPGLEIDADDVIAGHGATVGQIDEEQLFYLMARGIPEEQARDMIIRGFFEDLFKNIRQESVRNRFWQAIKQKSF